MSTVEFDESTPELGEGGAASVETASIASNPGEAAQTRGQIYTVLAREGVNAAEVINIALRKHTLGKAVPRRVEVASPHGPSTSGGKKARQSITLVPAAGQGPAIMVGFLDVAQKGAELRDYDVVAQQYRARFGSRFEITEPEYDALTADLSRMLGTLGFQVAEAEEEELQGSGGILGAVPKLVLVGASAALIIAMVVLWLLR